MTNDKLTTLLIIAIVATIFIFGPIVVIWSLNTLFPVLAIPYDIYTWFAITFIGAFLRANVNVNKK